MAASQVETVLEGKRRVRKGCAWATGAAGALTLVILVALALLVTPWFGSQGPLPDPAASGGALSPFSDGSLDDRQVTSSSPALYGLPDEKKVHRPLTVSGDPALRSLAQDHGRPGAGTKEDPLVLSGDSLLSTGLGSLVIEGTRAHLIVKDLELEGVGGGNGLTLKDTANVTVRSLTVSGFQKGLQAVNATKLVIERSFFGQNQWALTLTGSQDTLVRESEFQGNGNSVMTHGDQPMNTGLRVVGNTFNRDPLDGLASPVYDNGSAVVLVGQGHEVTGNTFSGHAPTGLRVKADHVTVADNRFAKDNRIGIVVDQTRDVVVRDNHFERNLEVAVFTRDTVDTEIRDNVFENNPNGGLRAREDQGMRIEDNRFSWSEDAVYLWSPMDTTITGNTVYGGKHAVRIVDGEQVTVRENEITNPWEAGVSLYRGTGIEVTQNVFASGKQHGVHVLDTKQVVVSHNLIDTTRQGVVIQRDAQDVEIKENRVKGLGLIGLRVIASDDVRLLENTVSDQDFALLLQTNATNVRAAGGEFYWNQAGIHVVDQQEPLDVSGIEARENRFGLWVQDAAGHDFRGLGLDNNSIGVFFVRAEDNTLESSTIMDNKMGMYFVRSTGNEVYNNKVGNPKATHNVLLTNSPDNRWHVEPVEGENIIGGPWIAGNWWHDYEGPDVDDNGLGDLPYQPIPYHPLLETPAYELGLPMGPFDLHPLVHEGRSPPV